MKKVIFYLILVALFFSCDPVVGTLSKEDFDISLFAVDGSEKRMELSYGIDFYYNLFKVDDIAKQHDLVITMRIDRKNLFKDQHFNLTISNDLKYEDFEVITGDLKIEDDKKKIESISNGEYEDLKIKFLWKDSFYSRSEIIVSCIDNKNEKRYAPIMFRLGLLEDL